MSARRLGRARVYLEHGQPVEALTWWAGRCPRNVLIRRGGGELVVRPFRGLRHVDTAPIGARLRCFRRNNVAAVVQARSRRGPSTGG